MQGTRENAKPADLDAENRPASPHYSTLLITHDGSLVLESARPNAIDEEFMSELRHLGARPFARLVGAARVEVGIAAIERVAPSRRLSGDAAP